MVILYSILFITTFAMLAVLSLMFFAERLRKVLKAQLYYRTFSFFAIVATAGILFAGILGFSMPCSKVDPSLAVSLGKGK